MRIVSLIPSATEIVALLGAESDLLGRSHECDFPPSATHATVLTKARTAFAPAAGHDSAAIDSAVRASLDAGTSLYELETGALADLEPDLVITQDLCSVCSIDAGTVSAALDRVAERLGRRPEMLALNPLTLEDVLDDVLRVGAAIERAEAAEDAVVHLRERLYRAQEHVNAYTEGPRVAFIEWTSPIFVGGHWTPQLIDRAGASHPLNPATPRDNTGTATGMQQTQRVAGPSITKTPDELVASAPEAIIISPCGLTLAQTREAADADLASQPWWSDLPAVRAGRVALVDGNQMFNRPGPRLIDAAEWLVGWLHDRPGVIPADFPWEPWSR